MAFDGVDYQAAELIYPAAHHPGAPMTGPALGSVLRAAYAHARSASRGLMVQTYGINTRTGARLGATSSTSWFPIAECYRRIHAEATHIVADCRFSTLLTYTDSLVAQHRIVVTTPTSTITGDALETPLGQREESGEVDQWSPFGAHASYRAQVELPLTSAAKGVLCMITIEAAATRFVGTVADVYQPHIVSAWVEVRG